MTLPSRARGLLSLCLLVVGQLSAQSLEAVLARMDQAAAGFKAMTASIEQASFTAVLNESTKSNGIITVERPKAKDFRMLVDFQTPDPRSVYFAGNKLQLYYPKLQTIQEYDLGKQGSLIEQFLLLGFGTPGSDLKKYYDVKYIGEESVGSDKASRLELTPKSKEALQQVKKIEIWVSAATGQPVQQKVFQPSRDYQLITYTNMKVNPALASGQVALKVPSGVKKTYPQR